MSLERITKLHSIEVLFPERAINARWDSFVAESGVRITEPTIVRKAYPSEEFAELLPQITDIVSADYLKIVAENSNLLAANAEQEQKLQAAAVVVTQLQEVTALLQQKQELETAMVARLQELEAAIAARDARVAELEQELAEAAKPTEAAPENG